MATLGNSQDKSRLGRPARLGQNRKAGAVQDNRASPSLGEDCLSPYREQAGIDKPNRDKRQKKQPQRQAIPLSLRRQVLERDHFGCRQCGASSLSDKALSLEIDHIVPVCRGGTNDPHNLQTLCRQCNRGKKANLTF